MEYGLPTRSLVLSAELYQLSALLLYFATSVGSDVYSNRRGLNPFRERGAQAQHLPYDLAFQRRVTVME